MTEDNHGMRGKDPVCTWRRQFCMGHRVYKDEGGTCAHLHGHSYVAMFHARAERADDGSIRVVDPGVLKEDIGGWIDHNWDHGFVLWQNDPLIKIWGINVRRLSTTIEVVREETGQIYEIEEIEHKIFVFEMNPTTANLADYLLHQVCPSILFGRQMTVFKVSLWETEDFAATAELSVART